MMLTTNVKIEMIKLIFSYFVIVSPPPILGRDEPNSRRWLSYALIIPQNFANRLYFNVILARNVVMCRNLVALYNNKITKTHKSG